MTDNDPQDLPGFEDKLGEAAAAGRPPTDDGLGAMLVARGRKRRRQQQVGQAVAAVMLVTVAIVGVTNIGGNTGAPIVTTQIDGVPTVEESSQPSADDPSSSDGAEAGAAGAQPGPSDLPSEVATLLPGEPSSSESPEPDATSTPTANPGPSGATRTGVQDDSITIYVAGRSDQSTYSTSSLGTVPGVTTADRDDPAVAAVRAYGLYLADQGGVHGRNLSVNTIVVDGTGTQASAAYKQACDKGFAMVGTAVDPEAGEAAASQAASCGLPDIRSASRSWEAREAATTFSVRADNAMTPSLASWENWAARMSDATFASAWIRTDEPARNEAARSTQGFTTELGYEWVYDLQHGRGDTSWYSSAVHEMQNAGVEFVHFDGDPVDLIRLRQQMSEVGFEPEFFTIAQDLYMEELAGPYPDLYGVEVAIDTVPFFEASHNTSTARYLEWLAVLEPNAVPSLDGAYAWAATELFVDSLRSVGPDPTRQEVLRHLAGVRDFTARGMLGSRSIRGEGTSNCLVNLVIAEDGWLRNDDGAPGTLTC